MSSLWPMLGELSVTFMWAPSELTVSSNSSLHSLCCFSKRVVEYIKPCQSMVITKMYTWHPTLINTPANSKGSLTTPIYRNLCHDVATRDGYMFNYFLHSFLSEEFELTANLLGAHIGTLQFKLILRTLSYLRELTTWLTLWACCELFVRSSDELTMQW